MLSWHPTDACLLRQPGIQDKCGCSGNEALRAELAFALLSLLGAPLGPWRSTNDPYDTWHADSADDVAPDLAELLVDEESPENEVAHDVSWVLPGELGGQRLAWFQVGFARIKISLSYHGCKEGDANLRSHLTQYGNQNLYKMEMRKFRPLPH
jgi:hypothetical protein